jgi:streptomycin 6-kinase
VWRAAAQPFDKLLAGPNPARTLARRVDILADELGLDPGRIRDWGVAQAVLSACWTIEDHGHGWEPVIAFAELLAGVPAGERVF